MKGKDMHAQLSRSSSHPTPCPCVKTELTTTGRDGQNTRKDCLLAYRNHFALDLPVGRARGAATVDACRVSVSLRQRPAGPKRARTACTARHATYTAADADKSLPARTHGASCARSLCHACMPRSRAHDAVHAAVAAQVSSRPACRQDKRNGQSNSLLALSSSRVSAACIAHLHACEQKQFECLTLHGWHGWCTLVRSVQWHCGRAVACLGEALQCNSMVDCMQEAGLQCDAGGLFWPFNELFHRA